MTHADLVEVAYRWVLKNTSCQMAFKELEAATSTGEIPDVIGFCSDLSVVIECKVSWADFVADRKKPFRIDPSLGMGTQRFYCCPDGIVSVMDLPYQWGLIWVHDDGKLECIYKPYKGPVGERKGFSKNIEAENAVLYSALRRLMKEGK